MKPTEREFFNFYELLSEAYKKLHLEPGIREFGIGENPNPISSLKHFIGYVFQRRGVPSLWEPVAREVIDDCIQREEDLGKENLGKKFWDNFIEKLKNASKESGLSKKLNPKNNPLAPKGTSYKNKKSSGKTRQLSVIQFLSKKPKYNNDIIKFAKERLESDKVQEVHDELKKITGVGDKIASFYLRDVAIYYDISVTKDCHLLQPIDTWVERTAGLLFPKNLKKEKFAKKIVEVSERYDCNPENVNAGMWFLGSEIAGGNYYKLCQLMKNKERLWEKTRVRLPIKISEEPFGSEEN